MRVKHENKQDLAKIILKECGVAVSPDALFDVQIKRLLSGENRGRSSWTAVSPRSEISSIPDPPRT